MKQLQHGDVILQEVNGLPSGVSQVKIKAGCIILAEGEATGHHHTITDEGCKLFELKGELYLEVTAPEVVVTHEEHKAIPIPTGIYKVGRVQEYDYFAEMARQVRD